MPPAPWDRIQSLFDELTALPAAERAVRLHALRSEDPSLCAELESLLRAHEEPGGPLDAPPVFNIIGGTEATTDDRLAAGLRIGPYQLVRLLGEGGMGSVWLAERVDGRLKRSVALKLPKWTWTLRDVNTRLARERDILARLEHAGIARLYDAGVDELGRPYLAMEYVQGEPIDQYCNSRALTVVERLQLVLQVARAVAYAHSRLIVHRDLKPSNILVSDDGTIRLLDFGIATLLQADDDLASRITQAGSRVFTLDYAAPEQIKGESIGTPTDVYALGCVLYALVAVASPYPIPRRSPAALEDAIVTGNTLLASDACQNPAIARQLRGDLDAILNKAIKKNPEDRYASIDAFAADLTRFLRHETIVARPDSRWYRFRKFARRNRVGLGAAGVAAIAVLGGAGVSLWQARIATAEATRANATNAFVLSLFRDASPSSGGGAELRVVDLLQQALPRIEREFRNEPEQQLELYLTVGLSLNELNSYASSLATFDRTAKLAQRQQLTGTDAALRARIGEANALVATDKLDAAAQILDSTEQTLRQRPPSLLLAHLWSTRAYLHLNRNDPQAAVKSDSAATDLIKKLLGPQNLEYWFQRRELARAQWHADQCDAAIANADEILTQLPALLGSDRHPEIAVVRSVRARCLSETQRVQEARAEFERNEPLIRAAFGAGSKDYAIEILSHAETERRAGASAAAVNRFIRGNAILDANHVTGYTRMGAEAGLTLTLLQNRQLAAAALSADRWRQFAIDNSGPKDRQVRIASFFALFARALSGEQPGARTQLERMLQIMHEQQDGFVMRPQTLLGWYHVLQRAPDLAEQELTAALPVLEARGVNDQTYIPLAHLWAGVASLDRGDLTRARKSLDRALAENMKMYFEVTPERADLWVALARLNLLSGDNAAALTWSLQAIAFWQQQDPKSRWSGEAAYWHAMALDANGRHKDAALKLNDALILLRQSSFPIDRKWTAEAQSLLKSGKMYKR